MVGAQIHHLSCSFLSFVLVLCTDSFAKGMLKIRDSHIAFIFGVIFSYNLYWAKEDLFFSIDQSSCSYGLMDSFRSFEMKGKGREVGEVA